MAEALIAKVPCGSGFRRDCMRGDKCRMWHIGEPTNTSNEKPTNTSNEKQSTATDNEDEMKIMIFLSALS